MNRRRLILNASMLALTLPAARARATLDSAQGPLSVETRVHRPGSLVLVRRPGEYKVRAGDLIQVAFLNQSTPDAIESLSLELRGEAVRYVAVASWSDGASPPGSPYFLSAYLRAEGAGRSIVRIVPAQYDGVKRTEFVVELVVAP